MPKILVILMSSGENELQLCEDSINRQQEVNFDVFHIKDKSNKEAHEICYSKIMEKKSEYTHFIKIDADMVFFSNTKLVEMLSFFESKPDLDHVVFSVLDWASQKVIIGMHMFSNRCDWNNLTDPLFVDPSPSYPGKGEIVWRAPAPVAWHSPDPSIKQSIQFGCHRAMKIIQKDRKIPNLEKSNFQYDLMYQVYLQSLLDNDERRLAILFGVYSTLKKGGLKIFDKKTNSYFDGLVSEFNSMDKVKLKHNFDKIWGGRGFKTNYFFTPVKFFIWCRFLFYKINKKIMR